MTSTMTTKKKIMEKNERLICAKPVTNTWITIVLSPCVFAIATHHTTLNGCIYSTQSHVVDHNANDDHINFSISMQREIIFVFSVCAHTLVRVRIRKKKKKIIIIELCCFNCICSSLTIYLWVSFLILTWIIHIFAFRMCDLWYVCAEFFV